MNLKKKISSLIFAGSLACATHTKASDDFFVYVSPDPIGVNAFLEMGKIGIEAAAAKYNADVQTYESTSAGARKLAEKEEIDIRLYSIIYKAIEEIKEAMEGMLSPEFKEEIVATAEIRETFKITKVGTIAGCYVTEGKINRNHKVRIIRDGIVVYSGELGSLKRFKDDVKEVQKGYECGLNIAKFNDIKEGDVVEAYEEVEVSRKI